MRRLTIEWKHLEKAGNTCLRCAETGRALAEVVANIQNECLGSGVSVEFVETKLPEDRICESNEILFNGIPLEAVLEGTMVSANYCGSCSELTGTDSYCRTVERDRQTYEEIPERFIWEAACRAAGCDCSSSRVIA